MTARRLILRSFAHHVRSHLGALAGTAVASAVLIGALIVGDSVRSSLRQLALLRLGRIETAMSTGDRLCRADLFGSGPGAVASIQHRLGLPSRQVVAAPVLQLPAIAVAGEGAARANQVLVHGVDVRFWKLAEKPFVRGAIPPGSVLLNQPLARQLRVEAGDELLLRVQKPSALSRDAPMATEEDATVALRLRVDAVLSDDQLGRFSLAANQTPPFNAFVSMAELQARVDAVGRANLFVAGSLDTSTQPLPMLPGGGFVPTSVFTNVTAAMNLGLRQRWRLDDAELELRLAAGSRVAELRSRRVFLDPLLDEAVPAILANTNAARLMPKMESAGLLTYFVNELRVGDRATPYSMVTAAAGPLLPGELADGEILISRWLADDLEAKAGDTLTLAYYVMGTRRDLIEQTAQFRIKGIYEMNTPGIDRSLMPDFPGMTDADNCRDWDTGLPIQNDRIRPKDEEYWQLHRGTPKAFITLATGQKLWANRFGDLTAIRFAVARPSGAAANAPGGLGVTRSSADPIPIANLGSVLSQGLAPGAFGMTFRPVRDEALAASAHSQDFGQLFLGLSFFLIAAALLLVALLFTFGVETRATEVGTLLALGFRPGQVRRLLLWEGGLVAFVGAILGAKGATLYAQAMLKGLSTVWNQAVGGATLSFHLHTPTILLGVAASILVTVVAMWFALRHQAAQPARALLAGGAQWDQDSNNFGDPVSGAQCPTQRQAESPMSDAGGSLTPVVSRISAPGQLQVICALAATALALGLAFWGWQRGEKQSAGLFFAAGALLLVAGLCACAGWLVRLAATSAKTRLTRSSLAVRGATRRRRRSLAVIGLLASGSFLVAAIGVFRLDAVQNAQQRSSGTGGFALIGQSTQPVLHDLESERAREVYGLDAARLEGMSVVPFRVREGDEASCLNLNRAQEPRILGVAPGLLAKRSAFTFAQAAKGLSRFEGWNLLVSRTRADSDGAAVDGISDDDTVPAIGDQASVVWALGKKVGDTIPLVDERGRPFRIRLVAAVANSILQGNLIIAENEFVKRFPGVAGYRMFLIDTPSNRIDQVSSELTRGLQDLGLELTPASERLAAFNAVQNTYLGTFQVLGGLGLLLGSLGLGVVVLRNVLERRGEYALLLAVGWERSPLRRLVIIEHGVLLAAGLAVGVCAAFVAVLPSVLGPGTEVPYWTLAWTLAGVLLNGFFWTWLATLTALRGNALEMLRNNQ